MADKRKVQDRNNIVFGPFPISSKDLMRELDDVKEAVTVEQPVSEVQVVVEQAEPLPSSLMGVVTFYDSVYRTAWVDTAFGLYKNIPNGSGFALLPGDHVIMVVVDADTVTFIPPVYDIPYVFFIVGLRREGTGVYPLDLDQFIFSTEFPHTMGGDDHISVASSSTAAMRRAPTWSTVGGGAWSTVPVQAAMLNDAIYIENATGLNLDWNDPTVLVNNQFRRLNNNNTLSTLGYPASTSPRRRLKSYGIPITVQGEFANNLAFLFMYKPSTRSFVQKSLPSVGSSPQGTNSVFHLNRLYVGYGASDATIAKRIYSINVFDPDASWVDHGPITTGYTLSRFGTASTSSSAPMWRVNDRFYTYMFTGNTSGTSTVKIFRSSVVTALGIITWEEVGAPVYLSPYLSYPYSENTGVLWFLDDLMQDILYLNPDGSTEGWANAIPLPEDGGPLTVNTMLVRDLFSEPDTATVFVSGPMYGELVGLPEGSIVAGIWAITTGSSRLVWFDETPLSFVDTPSWHCSLPKMEWVAGHQNEKISWVVPYPARLYVMDVDELLFPTLGT